MFRSSRSLWTVCKSLRAERERLQRGSPKSLPNSNSGLTTRPMATCDCLSRLRLCRWESEANDRSGWPWQPRPNSRRNFASPTMSVCNNALKNNASGLKSSDSKLQKRRLSCNSLRSRRKRKAWGAAQRNPRNREAKTPQPAEQATDSYHGKRYRPLRGLASSLTVNLGFRYAPPQALRYHLLRRLEVAGWKSTFSGKEFSQTIRLFEQGHLHLSSTLVLTLDLSPWTTRQKKHLMSRWW